MSIVDSPIALISALRQLRYLQADRGTMNSTPAMNCLVQTEAFRRIASDASLIYCSRLALVTLILAPSGTNSVSPSPKSTVKLQLSSIAWKSSSFSVQIACSRIYSNIQCMNLSEVSRSRLGSSGVPTISFQMIGWSAMFQLWPERIPKPIIRPKW